MTLRFAIPNSGLVIEITEGEYTSPGISDLAYRYEQVGGDRDFLEAHIKRAITAFEHGAGMATAQAALGGEVISDEPSDPDADSAVVDDPWAQHPSERTTQPARKPQNAGAPQHRGDPSAYLGEDRFENKFYADPAAPECLCGVKSIRGAFVSQQGKKYGAYVCADAGPKDTGADYRNKCGFREFINGPKKGR